MKTSGKFRNDIFVQDPAYVGEVAKKWRRKKVYQFVKSWLIELQMQTNENKRFQRLC